MIIYPSGLQNDINNALKSAEVDQGLDDNSSVNLRESAGTSKHKKFFKKLQKYFKS